jgi:hypothetical protein
VLELGCRATERGVGTRPGWVGWFGLGLGSWDSPFLFLFSYFKLYSNLIESIFEFEFKTLALKQKEQCTSMNAQTF